MDKDEEDKTLLLRIISVLQILGALIGTIVLWTNNEILLGFIVLTVAIIMLGLLKGFQDVIELLDSINNKLSKS